MIAKKNILSAACSLEPLLGLDIRAVNGATSDRCEVTEAGLMLGSVLTPLKQRLKTVKHRKLQPSPPQPEPANDTLEL